MLGNHFDYDYLLVTVGRLKELGFQCFEGLISPADFQILRNIIARESIRRKQ
jgi:hypothetical protein